MKNFKWQMALYREKRVLVRACRRAGKTVAALEWLRGAGENAIFVTINQTMVRVALQTASILFGEDIKHIQQSGQIVFEDGQTVRFVSASNTKKVRGMRVDTVVFDDIGSIKKQSIKDVLDTVKHLDDFYLFGAYSVVTQDGLKWFEEKGDVAGVTYKTVDYLDLLEDGVFSASNIRDIKGMLTPKAFSEEFGPYEVEKKQKRKNINYKHLLDAQ